MNLNITENSTVKKDKQIVGVQMNASLVEKIKVLANERFISVSDAIRMMILDYFNRHEQDNEVAKLDERNVL